jgi:hypothetical protein
VVKVAKAVLVAPMAVMEEVKAVKAVITEAVAAVLLRLTLLALALQVQSESSGPEILAHSHQLALAHLNF